MIVDSLDNIDNYKSMYDIYSGLLWLKKNYKNYNISLGVHKISDNVKAIVSEYKTVEKFERGFEAHKYVIDIQYPLIGLERVFWSPINDMSINIPYEKLKDRTFYNKPHKQSINVDIGNSIFAIYFPSDGHSPQHFIDQPSLIKKITLKVKIDINEK